MGTYWLISTHHAFQFIESQKHWGCKTPWEVSRPIPCSEQGQLQQIAKDCIQLSSEYFQRWTVHTSGQPVPVFEHHHTKRCFLLCLNAISCISDCGHCLTSSPCTPYQVFLFLCSRLSPSSLSLPLYHRCSKPFIISFGFSRLTPGCHVSGHKTQACSISTE